MRKLISTAGLPRSGKSTWAKKQGHPIVNPDSIRLAIHGKAFYGPAEPYVWAVAYTMVEALFLAGHETVILDATNVSEARRQPWKKLAERLMAEYELVIIDTSPRECIDRAKAESNFDLIMIIERMATEWDLPRRTWATTPASGA